MLHPVTFTFLSILSLQGLAPHFPQMFCIVCVCVSPLQGLATLSDVIDWPIMTPPIHDMHGDGS
jgi:hypothetical protein